MKRTLVLIGGTLLVGVALAPSALAAQTGYQWTTGTVQTSNSPVQVCLGGSCQTTPPLSSINLNLSVVTDSSSTAPRMIQGTCAGGTGATVMVIAGSGPTLVGGSASGTKVDGSPYLTFLSPVTLPPNGTVTASACVAPTVSSASLASARSSTAEQEVLARLSQLSQLSQLRQLSQVR